jgi:signal transduction histidine kinase
VARDISERILIEDEFKTTTLKLKKRNQLKNEIAITVTEALLNLLADGNIDRAKKVISDYLDISKIEAGKLEIERKTFSIATVVPQVFETLLTIAQQKNIELKYFMPEYALDVNGDNDRIAQVLLNLVSRAIEISPPNGHITVRVRDVGGEIAVEIQDEGAPLERDQIHSIVNRHDWIKEQFRAGREDLALGLWIAKELVEMHGGRIWAESLDSERNNFCFTVPKSGVRKEVPVEVASASAS